MILKRIAFLTFLLWLVIPTAAFGQSWMDISPAVVYHSPGDPSCFTVTVGDGAGMTIDAEFYYQGSGPYEAPSWLTLDGSGQAMLCADGFQPGDYVFTGVRYSYFPGPFVPVYSPLTVIAAVMPVINALVPTCDNWDCLWVGGLNFQQDSYVQVYSTNWLVHQFFYGPESGHPPSMGVSGDGSSLAFQITDPDVLTEFGNGGIYLMVVNSNGTNSGWAWTHSPPPVLTTGGTTCDDQYCVWLTGSFPLNADVDLRIPGQNDVIPNAYSDLNVTPTHLSLRLNPGVRHDFDVSGLVAWVVNRPLANWSDGYYIAPIDRAIIGNVEGVALSGQQYDVYGWACAKTYAGSIALHVYVGGPAGAGTFAFSGTANLGSEPGLAAVCNSIGSAYRFSLPIPHTITQNYGNQSIYIHGISPFGLANSPIGNSGTFLVPAVDRSVTGFISGVVLENQQYYLRGWACAKTYSSSIDVHLYAGGPSGSGTFVVSATANQSSNPVITASCSTGGASYGFSIQLPLALRQQFGAQTIYMHGISPFGLANSLLGNSGNLTFPSPVATSSREYIYVGDRLLAVDITNLP